MRVLTQKEMAATSGGDGYYDNGSMCMFSDEAGLGELPPNIGIDLFAMGMAGGVYLYEGAMSVAGTMEAWMGGWI